MAYDFLGLVNDINKRLNEVELTTSTFPTAIGFYSAAKDSVNAAIRMINHEQFEWPFNHVTEEEYLLAGEVRYAYPSDAKTIDMDSFRIKRNSTFGNETRRLKIMSYEEYLDKYVDYEYTTDEGVRGLPEFVFRAPSFEYGMVPPPKYDYELVYEYYRLPVDLINATDVPAIPEQFRSVIVDGAMYNAYLFRGNSQDAATALSRFMEGIKNMRTLYINRYDYVRDTRVNIGNISSISGPRIS